jgi:hypothetical protein
MPSLALGQIKAQQIKADSLSKELELCVEIKTNVRREWMQLLPEAGGRCSCPASRACPTISSYNDADDDVSQNSVQVLGTLT